MRPPTARAFRAFLLAVVLPPIAATTLIAIYIAVAFSQDLNSEALEPLLMYIFMTGLLLSLGGCLVIGLPAHLLLRRLRRTDLWTYGALGLAGSLAILALNGITSGRWIPSDPIDWAMTGLTICGGPFAGYIFWRIARPDRAAIEVKA